jgi:hypothetical protein
MRRKLELFTATLIAGAITAGVAAAASTPAVVTGSPSSVGETSAVLNGTVNPEGSTTSYQFQWGLTTAYGSASASHSAGKGTKAVSVKTTAGGLIPGSLYHYRLVASNGSGLSVGRDRTFISAGHPPPTPITGAATAIGRTSARLTGFVNTSGETTSWAFQWGLTPAYGFQTFGGTVAASGLAAPVAETLLGLADGTTFHYRLVAVHGTTIETGGADQTFTTLPDVRPYPRIRAITLPGQASSKPYLFTTTGGITPPGFPPGTVGCSGTVSVHFMFRGRAVATTVAPVQPNCSFFAQVLFGKLIKHHARNLHVVVRFRGNSYLAPTTARVQTVRLG